MPLIALKVDVDTLRGTEEGVPRLLERFERAQTRATFLYSLGPDHTGRAIRRVFRRGFFQKVQRTSVIEHYGVRTLLYGTLLPGPDIARRCAPILRAVQAAGHENGIHTWDHVSWQDFVRRRDANWTESQMRRAYERFVEVFGVAPSTHGAAGWQMNAAALGQLDRWSMRYASDGRTLDASDGPYRIALEGRVLTCAQLPTTLPTFDELIGVDGMDGAGAARRLLKLTESGARDHVFTLHSELEGAKLEPYFATLLAGWRAQGYQLGALDDYFGRLDATQLPLRHFAFGEIPGRSGEVMVAGSPA
jgi:peptidoglycan/xylan/chitin deacetylase (PgdA/CDA1 family)